MSNDNDAALRNQLFAQIRQLQAERTDNRKRERSLRTRSQTLKSFPLVGDTESIRRNLEKILPKEYVPTNIGKYSEVSWPFYIPYTFQFGTDPVYLPGTRQSQFQKITQESAFLLFGMHRNANEPKDAGLYAPLQMTFKDRQSSRQYNDTPFPLQMLGHRGRPTYFATPLYIAKNARLEVELSSWVDDAAGFSTTGSGRHQIVLIGSRIRDEDASRVLSTIFL